MSSYAWTVARDEKSWRRNVRKHLKIYARGRFKTIEDVVCNLLFNISAGMPISNLSFREMLFFEYQYGQCWYEMIKSSGA